MADHKKLRGSPPKRLTGKMPVAPENSPWWDQVASEIGSSGDLGGKTLTVEELAQIVPPYPDGNRPRARTIVRRLTAILELVERGPNGSRSRGATYRIVPYSPPVGPTIDEDDDPVSTDDEWLDMTVQRMTRGR